MQTTHKQVIDLREYKDLIETVAKVEYSKLSTGSHIVDYQELVNLNTHTLYILLKNGKPENYNNAYLSTAMKWAIRNEIRRRYKWYSLKQKKLDMESAEEYKISESRISRIIQNGLNRIKKQLAEQGMI